VPSLISSDTTILHEGSSLPAPSTVDEELPSSFASVVRRSGGKVRGGPLRLVLGLASSAPETVTSVRAYLRREGTWRQLSVPGLDAIYESLAIGLIPVEFILELVGDAQDLRISATTAEDKTYTVTVRRLDEVV
jgi:hypothetical protein